MKAYIALHTSCLETRGFVSSCYEEGVSLAEPGSTEPDLIVFSVPHAAVLKDITWVSAQALLSPIRRRTGEEFYEEGE